MTKIVGKDVKPQNIQTKEYCNSPLCTSIITQLEYKVLLVGVPGVFLVVHLVFLCINMGEIILKGT